MNNFTNGMNIDNNDFAYSVVKATKADNKAIKRFYKTQRYSASYIGQDHCYLVKNQSIIIASAIISAGQENGDYWLLHGLVTDQEYRGLKIASSIIRKIIDQGNHTQDKGYTNIICFADSELRPFYLANRFISYNAINELNKLPLEFKQRLVRYQEKHKNLQCFLYHAQHAAI
jgi:GNAT superfamily N-acetyltransferase